MENNINEANSDLQGKTYKLPLNVIQFLQAKTNSPEGGKRVSGLLNNPNAVSYEQLKRFKHDIESGGNYNGDWGTVLNWINSILGRDRNTVDNQKRTTMEIGMENRFRKTHDKNTSLTPLSEVTAKKIKITEKQNKLIEDFILNEANKTVCQTPDAKFHTKIEDKVITCTIDLPKSLELDETEAKLLETNIHNAMELVLSKYFIKED